MDIIAILNIALEFFCILISSILAISILIGEDRRSKLNRIFTYMLIGNILVLLCDAATWILHGFAVTPATSAIIRIANFGVYSIGYVILALFTNYLVTYIGTKIQVSRKIVTVIVMLCAVAVGLVVISQFNHMYYYFDEKNVYHRQNWYGLSQVWAIVLMLVNSALVILYRKHLDKREFWILLSYEVLPVIAMAVQIISFGLTLLYMGSTLSMVIIYIGIQTELSKRLKQKELELTESRIDVMLTQIQPHFIYNTLATIEAFCNKDNSKEAAKMVHDFSSYLRENMDSLTQKELVSFNREIEHIKIYLDIEKQRLRERLTVVYELEITDFQLPILTVQPLVENAVRYGVSKKRNGGTITISTRLVPEGVEIIVSDDGVGFDSKNPKHQDERSHIGIKNVRERLRTQCGGTLTIESEIGKGTVCTIIIMLDILNGM